MNGLKKVEKDFIGREMPPGCIMQDYCWNEYLQAVREEKNADYCGEGYGDPKTRWRNILALKREIKKAKKSLDK